MTILPPEQRLAQIYRSQAYAFAFGHGCCMGGGTREERELRREVAELEARSRHGYHRGELAEPVEVPPGRQPQDGVGPRDEEQLDVRAVELLEQLHRVRRVGRPDAVDLEPGHGEAGVGRGAQHGHHVAILGIGVGLLLPRLAGGHEHHPVEAEVVQRLGRDHEMPRVDRVEGPAHDAQAAQRSLLDGGHPSS